MRARGIALVGMCLMAIGLLSCAPWTKPAPEPTSTATGPVRIGIVTSISGSLARFGQAHLQGYDLALQEINAAGGVLGRPLKLVFEDDGSVPEAAAAAVEKLRHAPGGWYGGTLPGAPHHPHRRRR